MNQDWQRKLKQDCIKEIAKAVIGIVVAIALAFGFITACFLIE